MIVSIVEIFIWLILLYLTIRIRRGNSDMALFYIAGLATWKVAFDWIDDLPEISVILCFLGVYLIGCGFITPYADDRGARGLSQFKAMWHRVSGK